MIQTQLVVLAALGAKGDGVTALVGEIKNAAKRNRAAKLGMGWVRSGQMCMAVHGGDVVMRRPKLVRTRRRYDCTLLCI